VRLSKFTVHLVHNDNFRIWTKKEPTKNFNSINNMQQQLLIGIYQVGLSFEVVVEDVRLVAHELDAERDIVGEADLGILAVCSQDYVVEPASLKFLVQHGFDFNKQYSKGLTYYRGNDLVSQHELLSKFPIQSELSPGLE